MTGTLRMMTGPRVAEPQIGYVEETADELAKRYHLVLLDDDQHTYAYVIEMLAAVFGYGVEKAFALASVVDSTGRAILETAGLEVVTEHRQAVQSFGADRRIPTSKGSMSATIEEAG